MSLNSSQASVNASLASCIAHLQRSTAHLDSAITNLDAGVRDLPRTARVIQCIRHYELVSEPTLFTAQRALADEIEPEFEHLLRRVEQHLAKMERREKSLVSKAGLQEQRIEQSRPRLDQPSGGFSGGVGSAFAEREAREREERLKMLKNKRGRLEGTVDRLQMQMLHKERVLKMSTHYAGQ